MKQVLLCLLLSLVFTCAKAQSNGLGGEEFVGVWKIKARCVEVGCVKPSSNEPAEGALTAQTWTISQTSMNDFTLRSDNKSVGTLTGGIFDGEKLIFTATSYYGLAGEATNHIIIKLPTNGKITGSRMVGRQAGQGVCMWRFTFTGAE